MKKLGLIGGISWLSTVDYYTYINKEVNDRLGGLFNPACIIHSFNMGEIAKLMNATDYDAVLSLFTDAALKMKRDGAEGLVICANTMHMFADQLQERCALPVIHPVTATAGAVIGANIKKVGLLGTRPTMDMDFYARKLGGYGIETLVPTEADKDFIHENIFTELSRGIFTSETRNRYVKIIDELVSRGAAGIVLGCTDIPPLFRDYTAIVPLFDTTRLHAEAAVAFCLEEE